MTFNGFNKTIIFSVLMIALIIHAQDRVYADGHYLEVVGQVYPIQEEDLLDFILHRIAIMQQNGEWDTLQNQFRDTVRKHVDRPNPVSGINQTVQPKNWNFDPSISVPYDVRDSEGRLVTPAGTTINPLQLVTIHKALLFFDGDDKKQVAWAKKTNQSLSGKTKLILVNGSIMEQAQLFHQPIYFDQAGKLTTKFHIQHVPAIVLQEKDHLKIAEVLP